MWMYLKTIENLENISPSYVFYDALGQVKNIDANTRSFIFYADDTDISFKCIYANDKIVSGFHENDSVILNGYYYGDVDEAQIVVSKLEKSPLKLTGSMLQDSLILAEESYNIIHVMGSNGYISGNDWRHLQELDFKYRDLIKNILTEKDWEIYERRSEKNERYL